MKYTAILPEGAAAGQEEVPLGVHVVYEDGDHEELEHLLTFLEDYLEIPESTGIKRNPRAGLSKQHPYAQIADMEVSIPALVSIIPELENIDEQIVIGFLYPGNAYKRRSVDMATFRAYKGHLDETGKDWPILRKMYQAIEDEFFPQKNKLN